MLLKRFICVIVCVSVVNVDLLGMRWDRHIPSPLNCGSTVVTQKGFLLHLTHLLFDQPFGFLEHLGTQFYCCSLYS